MYSHCVQHLVASCNGSCDVFLKLVCALLRMFMPTGPSRSPPISYIYIFESIQIRGFPAFDSGITGSVRGSYQFLILLSCTGTYTQPKLLWGPAPIEAITQGSRSRSAYFRRRTRCTRFVGRRRREPKSLVSESQIRRRRHDEA